MNPKLKMKAEIEAKLLAKYEQKVKEMEADFARKLIVANAINDVLPNMVEVVRCKDCEHCDISYPTGKPTPWYLCKHNRWTVTRPDDFCSYGERRTDG